MCVALSSLEVAVAETKDAQVVWQGGMAFEGKAGSGFSVQLDSAEDAGGSNSGFRPMEMILVGLAGCTAMDVISILQKKRQDVTGFEVHAHGLRADDHPRVFTDITLECIVRGHHVDPKAVERSIELSETKYCSVMGMLKKSVNITTTYRVEEAE
jgi:putative redox protein